MNPQNGWGSARDASPGTPLWKRQFPQRIISGRSQVFLKKIFFEKSINGKCIIGDNFSFYE